MVRRTASPSLAAPSRTTKDIILRPATMHQAEAIFSLVDAASRSSTVLPRTRAAICEHLRDFVVALEGDEVVGCGALHIWSLNLGEIKSLVTAERMRGKGLGGRIVQSLCEEARRLGLTRLFVLTDSVDFFIRNGFTATDKATLPHKVWNECILCPKFQDCGEVALDLDLAPRG